MDVPGRGDCTAPAFGPACSLASNLSMDVPGRGDCTAPVFGPACSLALAIICLWMYLVEETVLLLCLDQLVV